MNQLENKRLRKIAQRSLLFFAAMIIQSCLVDDKSSHNVSIQEKIFNTDSAQKSLLAEYVSEMANPKKNQIDTNWKPKEVDFSELFPVFADNCSPCHSSTGNGPFVLTSFESIRKKAAVIKEVMKSRLMPPFLANVNYSSLINAPRLNDSVRWRIINWIDQGCNKAKYPYNKNLQEFFPNKNNQNYKTYQATEHIINSNNDSYQCFIIDLNLAKDTFIKSIRYRSSNPRTIHHIMVYLDTSNVLESSEKCWNCMKSDIVNKLVPIDSWSRGMLAYELSEDFAFRFPKGSKLLLQTHYGNEGNKGQKEQTSLDIFFRNNPKRKIKFEIINNLNIFFPANKIKTETIVFKINSPISLIGCVPHMHFLAKKIEIFAITNENKKVNILKIDDWDYLWQGSYLFKNLVELPANSIIYMNAVFDNTSKNKQQPNDPIKDVKYDTYSNEEMMVLCLYTTDFQENDKSKYPIKLLR